MPLRRLLLPPASGEPSTSSKAIDSAAMSSSTIVTSNHERDEPLRVSVCMVASLAVFSRQVLRKDSLPQPSSLLGRALRWHCTCITQHHASGVFPVGKSLIALEPLALMDTSVHIPTTLSLLNWSILLSFCICLLLGRATSFLGHHGGQAAWRGGGRVGSIRWLTGFSPRKTSIEPLPTQATRSP